MNNALLKQMERVNDHLKKELERYDEAHNKLIGHSIKLSDENEKLKETIEIRDERIRELEKPLIFNTFRDDEGELG